MELFLQKLPNGALAPTDEVGIDWLAKVKAGRIVRADVVQPRNVQFHRKWFVLAKFAFDIWSETAPRLQYRGQDVAPSFDRFRKDLTILCGHYEPEFGVRGELRLVAKSISFSGMSEDEFEQLYSTTIQVVLSKILDRPDLTPEVLRNYVDQVLRFD